MSDADRMTYNRTLQGDRYSPLKEITTANVKNLNPVATFDTGEKDNSRNRNKCCGIHPRKREGGPHPATEERFWCGLEAVAKGSGKAGATRPSSANHFQAVLVATSPITRRVQDAVRAYRDLTSTTTIKFR
jgi:hypothetical protein